MWCFLERPFHPTTLLSVVRTALRGRQRQYEARARLEALHESEAHARHAEASVRSLNETLEARVQERTAELARPTGSLSLRSRKRKRLSRRCARCRDWKRLVNLRQASRTTSTTCSRRARKHWIFWKEPIQVSTIAKLQQRLSHMRLATERGAKLTSQLLAFSRRQRLEPKPFDVNEALGEYAQSAAKHVGRRY